MISSRPKLPFASRTVKLAVSFAVLLSLYWLYALVAVPLIEPSAEPHRALAQSGGQIAGEDPRLEELRPLFPADAWELQSPKILESDQLKLLMQEPRSLGERRVQLRPCTMIFLPNKAGLSYQERLRQAVVLQSPEGAILEFDQPLNLRRMEMGRLVGGELTGPITIRSQGQSPGPEDDLLIVTRNVQINEKEISTVGRVEFRWGPHFGSGQHLVMKLAPATGDAPRRGANIGGLESFEVRHVERLHLEVVDWPGQKPAESPRQQPRTATPIEITCRGPLRFDPVRKEATLEDRVTVWSMGQHGPDNQLTCDLLVLVLGDQTDGRAQHQQDQQQHKQQPQQHSASSAPGGAEAGQPQDRGDRLSLSLRRIVAQGTPAVAMVPSRQLAIRAGRLQYDLLSQRITLAGEPEVMLRQGPNEVRARNLVYESAGAEKLGRLFADGPGWLRAQLPDRPDQQLYAQWNEHLRFRPHEQNQLLSLTGGARLRFRGVGEVAAKEIHFWFTETPAPSPAAAVPTVAHGAPKTAPTALARAAAAPLAQSHRQTIRLRPDRMLAQHGVVLDSQQVTARLEQLGVWFEPRPLAERLSPGAAGGHGSGPGPVSSSSHNESQPAALIPDAAAGRNASSALPAADSVAGSLSVAEAGTSPQSATGLRGLLAEPRRRFEAQGRWLRARVLLDEDIGEHNTGQSAPQAETQNLSQRSPGAEIAELILEDDARFVELLGEGASVPPVVVSGQRIHVVEASRPHAAITVVGRPALFEGRGLKLSGGNINLNRGTNRLWVDGPGELQLPLKRNLDFPLKQPLELQPPAQPGTLRIDWRQRMQFDGRSALLEQSVTARGPDMVLSTEVLEVQLQQGIVFAESGQDSQPQIEQILCRGGVTIESRRLRDLELASLMRARLADLAWHIPSGAIAGGGPGFMVGVFRSTGPAKPPNLVLPFAKPRSPEAAAAQGRSGAPLDCLHVRFQGSVRGNTNTGTLGFYDRVQAAFAPVASWDATLEVDDPRALGQYGGLLINSSCLTVTEMPSPPGNQRTVELEATGNTIVEAVSEDQRLYTARAQRIAYAQAKDLLVLEGDGRTDAELFYQPQPAVQPSRQAARRIILFPRSGKGWVEGARSLELTGFPQ